MSRINSMMWMDGAKDPNEQNPSWAQNVIETSQSREGNMEISGISTFKSMLEAEGDMWFLSNGKATAMHGGENNHLPFSPSFTEAAADHHLHHSNNHHQLMLNQIGSSTSCSPTPASAFASLDPSSENQQMNYYKSLIGDVPNNNPLQGSFDLTGGSGGGYLESALKMSSNTGVLNNGNNFGFGDLGPQSQLNLSSNSHFGGVNMLQLPQGNGGSGSFNFGDGSIGNNNANNSLLLNRSKILKPLDNSSFTAVGSQQPTLFQKRAALRKNLGSTSGGNLGSLNIGTHETMNQTTSLKSPTYGQKFQDVLGAEENERKRKAAFIGDDLDDISIDGSNLNYDSDDLFLENTDSKAEESAKNGSNANSTVTAGDQKGKKKGLPAKNLMAERRRRKKLNDRLYMLRSVVPKISKMDRASILGDAIDYLKELLQKINDLHNELESSPGSSSLTPTTNSFHPLTPTTARIKEELCPSAFASPHSSPTAQPARVEVKQREGRAVNIHMFCGRRPGILLSTLRAMDNLGLDVQQAVISCFNGFALDIFRAEQCGEGQEVNPEQIKAVLLESAGFHGMV